MLITTKKHTHRSYSCIQDANDGDKSCSSYIPFTQFTTCKKSVLVVHSSRHAKKRASGRWDTPYPKRIVFGYNTNRYGCFLLYTCRHVHTHIWCSHIQHLDLIRDKTGIIFSLTISIKSLHGTKIKYHKRKKKYFPTHWPKWIFVILIVLVEKKHTKLIYHMPWLYKYPPLPFHRSYKN